jgi:hypothetical protein
MYLQELHPCMNISCGDLHTSLGNFEFLADAGAVKRMGEEGWQPSRLQHSHANLPWAVWLALPEPARLPATEDLEECSQAAQGCERVRPYLQCVMAPMLPCSCF